MGPPSFIDSPFTTRREYEEFLALPKAAQNASLDAAAAKAAASAATIATLFADLVAASPDQLALEDPPDREVFAVGAPKTLTYAALAVRVSNLARSFVSDAGVAKGDYVMMQLPNVEEFITVCLACAQLGAIVTAIKMHFHAPAIRAFFQETRPRAFVGISRYESDIEPTFSITELTELFAETDGLTVYVVGSPGPGQCDLESVLSSSATVASPNERSATSITPEDAYCCFLTSGSTGKPKGIVHSNRSAVAFGRGYLDHFPISSTDSYKVTMHVKPADSYKIVATWLAYVCMRRIPPMPLRHRHLALRNVLACVPDHRWKLRVLPCGLHA